MRSPRLTSNNKEVCDHLFLLRGQGIIGSLKSQEDPSGRTKEKLKRWAVKAAKRALAQGKGAIRTFAEQEVYCDHPRRGRIVFSADEIDLVHLVVIVEAAETIRLSGDEFPLSVREVPVTYLTTNDFLNLVDQLRSFPDIQEYLTARRELPQPLLLTLGFEQSLYEYYLLNEFFDGCGEMNQIEKELADKSELLAEIRARKTSLDFDSLHIENVADKLATRNTHYQEGLDQETIAGFDKADSRENYLYMQEEICDLRLSERRLIGHGLAELVDKIKQDPVADSMAYNVFRIDRKPDFIYLLASARGVKRNELIDRLRGLLGTAIAYFGGNRGMAICDRDGKSYEVSLMEQQQSTAEEIELGRTIFGHLRITSYASSLTSQRIIGTK